MPPEIINKGPFHLYVMIDGHRGYAVSRFIRDHFMDVLYRNENIMVNKHYSIGLKQVFLKLDEILASKAAKEKMRDYMGYPEAKVGSIFAHDPNCEHLKNNENPAW
jgi:hypothetical protein